MRVFVTGAGGFVGRKLIPSLERKGWVAIGADREVDVTDPRAIARAIEEHAPDAVVHLAAMSSVALSYEEPERCHQLNVRGTRNLLAAARAHAPDARVLLIGSADQYGATEDLGRALDEATPLAPRSPYAKSKAEGEALGLEAAARGQDVVCVRAFNHTGAGQSDAFVASSFARQVAAIAAGRQAPVLHVGNLESVRDFLHVDDVLEAYAALLDRTVPADVYNVASGRPTTIQEVLDRLIALGGIEPEVHRDPDRFRPTDWLVGDATRLREATGWTPRVTLEALLEELYLDWTARDAESG